MQELSTFGFRGEALSSLCALADVSVVTRTADGAAGVRLTYDHAGKLTGTVATARATGTTVAVRELFKPLPVRFKVRAEDLFDNLPFLRTILKWMCPSIEI